MKNFSIFSLSTKKNFFPHTTFSVMSFCNPVYPFESWLSISLVYTLLFILASLSLGYDLYKPMNQFELNMLLVDSVKSTARSILNIPRDYVPSKYLKDLSKENTSAYPVSQKNAIRTLNFRPLVPLHNGPHFSPNNTLIHV